MAQYKSPFAGSLTGKGSSSSSGYKSPFVGMFTSSTAKKQRQALDDATSESIKKAQAASAPQHSTTTKTAKKGLGKVFDFVNAVGETSGTHLARALEDVAGAAVRAPTLARFAKPILPSSADRLIEKGVKLNRQLSDKTIGNVQKTTTEYKPFIDKSPVGAKVGRGLGIAEDVASLVTPAGSGKLAARVSQLGKTRDALRAIDATSKTKAISRAGSVGSTAITGSKRITDPSRMLASGTDRFTSKINALEKEKQAILKDPNAYSTNPEDLRSLKGAKVGRLNKSGTFAETRGATVASSADSAKRLREINREQKALTAEMSKPFPKSKTAPVTAPTKVKSIPEITKAYTGEVTKDKGARFTGALLSTTGRMTRHGAEGKQLANLTNDYAHTARDFSTEWFNRIPTVTKLRSKDSTNFARAVQGIEAPRSKKVAKAVDEWKALSPDIRGAFVKHSGQDIGNVENYFPRMVKDEYLKAGSKGYNAAIKHLVDTGQAKTTGEAVSALDFARKSGVRGNVIGSFKFHRDFNLPDKMYDTSKNAIANYLEGAAHSVSGAKVFGMDKSGAFKKADELIGSVAARGGNAEQLKHTFEQAMGIRGHNETLAKASSAARGVQVFTKLGLGAITNAGQTVNTIIKNGFIDTAKGAGYLATPAGRKYARETGAFTHGLINNLREAQGVVTKASKVGAPGFNTVEKFNRYLAATAGKFHGERLAKRVDRGGMLAGRAERDLRKMRVEGTIGKKLTKEQSLRAGRGSSDITQFEVAPHTLPGWSSSPVGKMVSQFQTFSYKQTGFVANEILKPLAEGNPLPLVRLIALLPVGYGIQYKVKDKLRSKDDKGDSAALRVLNAWRAAGGAGTIENQVSNVINAKKYSKSGSDFMSNLAGHALGPTAGTIVDTTKSTYSAMTGDKKPAQKQLLSAIPVVGPTLKNRVSPAGSDTSRHIAHNDSTLNNELGRLKYKLNDTNRTSGRAKQLSDDDYKQYLATSSYLFTQRAKKALSDNSYSGMSDEDKKKQMQTILTGARQDVLDHALGKPKRSKKSKFKSYR